MVAAVHAAVMDLRQESPGRRREVEIELAPATVSLLQALGQRALTVDLTLDFYDLPVKHAVAYPGPSDEGCGFRRVSVHGLDVYWRLRLDLPGRDIEVTTHVVPRRVKVGTKERPLAAEVDYA